MPASSEMTDDLRRRVPLGTAPPAPSDVAALVALVRLIALVACVIGLVEVTVATAAGEPRAIVLGVTAFTYGLWVATRVPSLAGIHRESTVTRIAIATLILV